MKKSNETKTLSINKTQISKFELGGLVTNLTEWLRTINTDETV